eukprot:TRINITY_DN3958_c0_g1_i1.p1 TRINITY_DN3958_c0_g1~~TRINITY_DN3958_c0_g1_i1.p1  ORF type:complete len:344 (+),score=98.92 TRINITY_DN3958_c0_g1_i1:74-1033(+)
MGKKAAAAKQPKEYDYSELEKGIKLQAQSEDGVWYAAEVVTVAKSKSRAKAPVKVHFVGYEKSYDEWLSGDKLRSKALKVKKPEAKTKTDKKPLEVEFGYWKIRGLAAVVRMILEYKGVKYTDNQYAGGEEWFQKDKPKILEKNPLANLPYIIVGDDCVCQTNAIFNYLGNKLRLNGFSYKARLLNDQLLCEVMDVRNIVIDHVYPFKTVCRSEEEHKTKTTAMLQGGPFKKFEAVLEKEGNDYFCGKVPCTSDFHIWEMLDQHKGMAEKLGAGDIFKDIPKCKAFYDRFRALPTLQKYFDSEAYKLPTNNPIANAYYQ